MNRIISFMMTPVIRRMAERSILKMLAMLEKTEEVEYTCDDAYAVLDVYTDMLDRGDDPAKLLPLVEKHLEMCGNCREEFEALRIALKEVG